MTSVIIIITRDKSGLSIFIFIKNNSFQWISRFSVHKNDLSSGKSMKTQIFISQSTKPEQKNNDSCNYSFCYLKWVEEVRKTFVLVVNEIWRNDVHSNKVAQNLLFRNVKISIVRTNRKSISRTVILSYLMINDFFILPIAIILGFKL